MNLQEFEQAFEEYVKNKPEKFVSLLRRPSVRQALSDELLKELEYRTGRRDFLKLGLLSLFGLGAIGTVSAKIYERQADGNYLEGLSTSELRGNIDPLNVFAGDWIVAFTVGSPAIIYRSNVSEPSGIVYEAIAYGSSNYYFGLIDQDAEDIGTKETYVDAGVTNKANIYNFDLDTEAYISVAASTAEYSAIEWDLGAVFTGFIFARVAAQYSSHSKMDVSQDGVTYTTVIDYTTSGAKAYSNALYYGSFRYIRWRVANGNTTYAENAYLASVEVVAANYSSDFDAEIQHDGTTKKIAFFNNNANTIRYGLVRMV